MGKPATHPRTHVSLRVSHTVVWLSVLIAILAVVAAGTGLFSGGGGGPSSFVTLRGETVRLYGQGLYRHDTLLVGSGFRGQDLVTLAVGVPLLLVSTLLYRRGSLRGGLLLTGTLSYFLYVYASMAFGAAYNQLFLLYVALFSASLFALVLAFGSMEPEALASRFSGRLPRRGVAFFLFVVGLVLTVVWLGLSLLPALLRGLPPPELASYSTVVTHVLDLGVIAPVSILAGVSLLRRAPSGYLLASTVLVLSWMMGLTIAAATVAQALAGYPYTTGQVMGLVAPFVVLALVGARLTVGFFRGVSDPAITSS